MLPVARLIGFEAEKIGRGAALHVDLLRASEQQEQVLKQIPSTMMLSLGVVDGRNIWKTDLDTRPSAAWTYRKLYRFHLARECKGCTIRNLCVATRSPNPESRRPPKLALPTTRVRRCQRVQPPCAVIAFCPKSLIEVL